MNIKHNYPMSSLTTLQIGGPARQFTQVKTQLELIEAIKSSKQNNIPFLLLGGGSNLLVSDSGIDCLVIKNETSGIERQDNILIVKSGNSLQSLVDYTIKEGLFGLSNLTGIPGTVGGAVYGNAGAYGQSISDYIEKVVCSDGTSLKVFEKTECQFAYRNSIFKRNHFVILEVHFNLPNANPKSLEQQAKEVLSKRLVKYPPGIKCPGSFFKNIVANTLPKEVLDKIPPEKIVYAKLPAGSLLEEVGAKGDHLGQIKIAGYHANLFINLGNGKAQDFYNLAKKYHQKVKNKFGISLEPEVQLINLPSFN